ncbi:MAG: hypothetical protein ACK6BM_03570, partial [Cyanobacteriota bacterium]
MTSYDIPLLNCGGVIFGSQGMGEALAPPGFKDPPTPNPNERVSAEWARNLESLSPLWLHMVFA